MAGSINSFINRLDTGKSWSLLYQRGGVEGLVEVWKHEAHFILTWEECLPGRQYDESEYTKDERFQFDTAAQLVSFLEKNDLTLALFKP